MTSRLQLHLSAKDLKRKSGMLGMSSKLSDPFAVVTVRGDNENNTPQIIGQTEVVFKTLNPSWSRTIYLDGYKFGVNYYIEVGVFDFNISAVPSKRTQLELSQMDLHSQAVITKNAGTRELIRKGTFPHRVIGTALFEVGQILGSRGNVGSKSLQTGGAIYAHIECCSTVDDPEADSGVSSRMNFQLQGHNLTNVQSLGRTSSPFYELYRKVQRPTGATWISIYRSNVVRNDLHPLWTEVSLDLEATCNNDIDRAMKVVVWDHRRSGKHKLMGEFETTIRGFIEQVKVNTAREQNLMKSSSNLNHNVSTLGDANHDGSVSGSAFDPSGHDADDDEEDGTFFDLIKVGQKVGSIQVIQATVIGGPLIQQLQQMKIERPVGSVNAGTQVAASTITPAGHDGVQNATDGNNESLLRTEQAIDETEESISRRTLKTSENRPEFVDYLSGGCQISLAVAIDFTASNGDPRQPGTPHHFHPPESKEWNDYEKAIFAVGSILAKYDSDQKFPVWGFGAKYNNVVRHCFQCGSEVEVEGVQGIMEAYRGVFRTPLTMSYPTKFTEVIETAASYARHEQECAEEEGKLSYTILLLLTAGNVEDVQETKHQLIEASDDPLSVVIVGIGDADFTGMQFLDDHDPETEGGRDITKFVRFADYRSFNSLTEAVLDEIPEQLVSYFFDRQILPGKLEDFNEKDVEIAPADDDDRTFTFLG